MAKLIYILSCIRIKIFMPMNIFQMFSVCLQKVRLNISVAKYIAILLYSQVSLLFNFSYFILEMIFNVSSLLSFIACYWNIWTVNSGACWYVLLMDIYLDEPWKLFPSSVSLFVAVEDFFSRLCSNKMAQLLSVLVSELNNPMSHSHCACNKLPNKILNWDESLLFTFQSIVWLCSKLNKDFHSLHLIEAIFPCHFYIKFFHLIIYIILFMLTHHVIFYFVFYYTLLTTELLSLLGHWVPWQYFLLFHW